MNTEMKHTPGPWLFGLSNRNNEAAIIGDTDSVVCYLPDASTGCTFKPADARLIAAAPMLLEALVTAQWMLERDYIDPQKMAVIDKCRAAIETAQPEPTP